MTNFRIRRPFAALLLAGVAFSATSTALAQVQAPPADPDDDETIVVTGQRAALNTAIEAEREADNLVNVIASEDIGSFADQNVAESLQRVPGITLSRNEGEGRSVSVRGLPSSFTTVTVNGVRLGTSDLEDGTVSLDTVSNDQLEQITVTKSVLPSQDADTIGGTIDLQTISAFTRRDERIQVEAEAVYVENAEKFGEEISANITRRFRDDTFGFAATLSYQRRPIFGVDFENDGGLRRVGPEGEPEYLTPNETTIATETGERTRWNASANLEFRPDDRNQFYLRGTYSHLNDDDLAYQDIWVLEESEDESILEVRPGGSGIFDETRYHKRLFFQNVDDSLLSLAVGGVHDFDNGWGFSYQADYSKSIFDNPEGFRGRFRVDDIRAEIDVSKEEIIFAPPAVGEEGDGGDPNDPGDYEFNQLLFIDLFREDTVMTGRADVHRDFEGGRFQFGAKYRVREKTADREEFTGNPEDLDFPGTLEDLPLFNLPTQFGYSAFFPERDATLDFFRNARDFLLANNPGYQRVDLSLAGDYEIEEEVFAGYAQAEFDPTPELKIIGGVRFERTSASSQGFFTEFDSSGRGPDGQPNTGGVINLGTVTSNYTDWFPGLHIRWEPTPSLIVRASGTRGLQRPDFNDRANSQRVQFERTSAGVIRNRDLVAGNPFLDPLTANSFDVSVAWYPARSTVLQAAVFYKDIKNFFFDFTGSAADIANTPIMIPAGVDPNFRRFQTTLNGETAEVKGVELSYVQSFTMLPGVLSGLFAQANVTFADSKATANVRGDEVFPLPDQRDIVGNLSVGWENESLSMRVAANYQGEALIELAGDAEEDIYVAPSTTVDFNLRYSITDNIQLSFDAVNVTDSRDLEFYQGDENGAIVFRNAAFGRVYKAGIRVGF